MTKATSNLKTKTARELTNMAGADVKESVEFDEAALVDRFRQGDMQAFGVLVSKYQDRIYNMILRM